MIGKFLSRRRRGAMAVIAMVGMAPVTAMMSTNLNTSQMVDDRRQMQDAADALANTHGAWTARALNIISMNNVTAAQLLTVAVGSEALSMTTTEIIAAATAATTAIKAHEARECRPYSKVDAVLWTPACIAWHEMINLPAIYAAIRAMDINSDFDPMHGVETARKALDAIDGMNKALAARHPRAMSEIAQSHYRLLDLDDHHFADPCNGPGVANCSRRNSRDGMALPLIEAETGFDGAYTRLAALMQFGTVTTDTTFLKRGFTERLRGPLRVGGSRARPELDEHINNITEVGNILYEFDWFYRSTLSDMPRHPLHGPGTALIPRIDGIKSAPYRGAGFVDRRRNLLDVLHDAGRIAAPINEIALGLARLAPIGFDRHFRSRTGTYLVLNPPVPNRRQDRTGNNSFHRFFTMLHMSVATPDVRRFIPVSIIPPATAVEVPEIFQLPGISPIHPAPPVEPIAMPDEFRILAFGQKAKSRRFGERIMSSPVTGHTGYAQAGVFNPDGATLFTQNWQSRLMPATRLDNPRQAGRDLDRAASAAFDDLASDLQQVRSSSSWGRVHAH
jgi:hypothetical protein